jgi:DNA repair photolyase
VRWHDQIATKDRETRLPGLGATAVTRTFDAPEALRTQFHEIHARSALNRVPGASKMPFGWTVNPYRGCAHACTYCSWGEMPVLLASGRTRRMADLRVGDEIYGTRFDGKYRRYVRTTVLDHWSSIKPAFSTALADGTELITSGDHRVLTQQRGWKHVTGSMGGDDQRPYLTTGNSLLGTGRFAVAPAQDADYRRGYLCGMVRGDGTLGTYHYQRPGRSQGTVHRFRLALIDAEGLDRTAAYLRQEEIETRRFAFSAATSRHRAVDAIRTSASAHVERIGELVRWPGEATDEWCKGYLAGIFDAEGSCSSSSAMRIANCDDDILDWALHCLERFGFEAVLEDRGLVSRCRTVRVRGGLKEQLRFFHLTDPAITRKRDIEGQALKSGADLRVVSVEPLGTAMRLYDITTGTGDYIGDGVVHHNCFARPTHEYLDFDAGRDFDEQIVVKVNAPEVLRAELRRPSWTREHIALGTNTDPYQWVEGRYRLTRAILEVLREARNPCSVLTKSPLLLRDLDVFLELMEVTEFSACLSIPTLDEKGWRATEPHTPHPRKRLEAVRALNEAGVPTGVLVAPLMPGINDAPEQVEAVVAACEEAGAVRIGGQALFLRGATKDVFMGWLQHARPDLVPLYERLYGRRAYLRAEDKRATEARLRKLTGRAPTKAELAARFQRGGDATAGAERAKGVGLPGTAQRSLF